MVTLSIEERQRRDRELFSRLRLLVAEGLTVNAMAERAGLTRVELARALARAGLPMPESSKSRNGRTIVRDVLRLFSLWNDCERTIGEIAQALNVTPGAVMRAARRYGLKRRQRIAPDVGFAVESDEDLASCESLRLAPTVAAAAAEVRKGWTEHERYQRRVQKVLPVTYGRIDCP
jgi:transcriptional regulator with XRE-family HTH domain